MEQNDLTAGSVTKKLLAFTLPFIISNLIQTMYGMVDLYIVGKLGSTNDMAAVSIGSIVTSTFAFLVIGLSIGATVVVGQHFGSKKMEELKQAVATSFSLFLLIGLGISIVLILFVPATVRWMNTPTEAVGGAISYLYICLGGLVFQAGYNTLSGVLRGLGDSKLPLLFVGVACVFNIVGDLILVGIFGMGATGAAIATTAAQAFSFIFGIIYTKRKGFVFDFRLSSFRIYREQAKILLRIGVPIALQETLVMFSFIILEAIINRLGVNATAAAGVLDKLFLIATIPATSFNASISAMVAQNMGAKLESRAKKCLGVGISISFVIGIFMTILAGIMPAQLVALFSSDPGVIEAGAYYFAGYRFEYPFCALAFCLHGFINGCGKTKISLFNNMISTFIIRVPLVAYLSMLPGATLLQIGYGLPVASAVQFAVAAIYFASGRWKA